MADTQSNPQAANNYLNIVDPSDAIELAKAQQRQALAAAMLQQGMQGMPGTQMAGNVAIRNSPWQGVSNLANTFAGGQALQSLAGQIGGIQQNRLTAAARTFDPNSQAAGPKAGSGPFEGLTPQQMLATELSTPGKLEQMQADWNMQKNKPTPETLSATQAGMPPEIREAYNARALNKSVANLKEDREGRIWDLTKGALVGVAPNLASGSTYGPIGANGFPTNVQSFPGGPESYQRAAFASASGSAGGGIGQYETPGGAKVPAYGVNAAGPLPRIPTIMGGQPPPMQPPQAAPGGMPGAQPPQQPPMPPQGIGQPTGGQQWGQTTSDAQVQQAAGQRLATLPAAKIQLQQSREGLESALRQMENLPKSGPGTTAASQWLAIASNLPGGKGLADPVAAYQLVHKYLANAQIGSAQASGANTSNEKFEASMSANPNEQQMNLPALKSSTRYVLSQLDAGIAGSDEQLNNYTQLRGRDPNAALTAQQKWTSSYDPSVFAYNRMDSAERAQFMASIGAKPGLALAQQPPAVQQFRERYAHSAEKGWVK